MRMVRSALLWVGIACIAGGGVMRFTMPAQDTVGFWALVAGIVLLVLYGLGQWDLVAVWRSRRARYGALASSHILLVVGILTAANYVLARQNVRWDLTAARQYSLADQTVQILESLEAPLRMLVFAQDVDFPRYRDRLAAYEYTTSRVSLEFVDPDKNPVVANQYEVQAYDTVILEYQDRIERVVGGQEQELTNALIKVIEGRESKVYFVQGHGEKDPGNTDRNGFSALGDALRLDNLAVESVVLAQRGEIPADAAVVVVAGPTIDWLPGEAELLRAYLEAGGKVLLLLDPPDGTGAADPDSLRELAAAWGITIGADVVVDVSGMGQLLGTDVTVPLAASYPPHPIVDSFALLTAFPMARSVTPIAGGVDGRTADPFVETSPRSWAETDMGELAAGEVMLTEGADAEGPITIGAAVSVVVEAPDTDPPGAQHDTGEAQADTDEAAADEDAAGEAQAAAEGEAGNDADPPPPLEARLAVIGDSDFASNSYLGMQGNRDFALNTINWLAQQEELIAVRPREPEDRRITVTAGQQRMLQWIVLVVVPAAIFGMGVHTWWRRRT